MKNNNNNKQLNFLVLRRWGLKRTPVFSSDLDGFFFAAQILSSYAINLSQQSTSAWILNEFNPGSRHFRIHFRRVSVNWLQISSSCEASSSQMNCLQWQSIKIFQVLSHFNPIITLCCPRSVIRNSSFLKILPSTSQMRKTACLIGVPGFPLYPWIGHNWFNCLTLIEKYFANWTASWVLMNRYLSASESPSAEIANQLPFQPSWLLTVKLLPPSNLLRLSTTSLLKQFLNGSRGETFSRAPHFLTVLQSHSVGLFGAEYFFGSDSLSQYVHSDCMKSTCLFSSILFDQPLINCSHLSGLVYPGSTQQLGFLVVIQLCFCSGLEWSSFHPSFQSSVDLVQIGFLHCMLLEQGCSQSDWHPYRMCGIQLLCYYKMELKPSGAQQ